MSIMILIILFQHLPKKEPEAADNVNMYMGCLSSLNFETKAKGTKGCWIFGLKKDSTYKVAPATYCLNLGKHSSDGTKITVITSKVKAQASAAMRWGYQRNELSGTKKELEDKRNENLLKYVYNMECTEDEFRYATQLAVWMMLDPDNSLQGYTPKDSNNKLYVLAKKIVKQAKQDIGKSEEDVGPRAIGMINPDNPAFEEATKNKMKMGPFCYKTSVYKYPYTISILNSDKSEKKDVYSGEYPKGFVIKSSIGRFDAVTEWSDPFTTKEQRKEANKKNLSKFIKKEHKSAAMVDGKEKTGNRFYIYADKDADMDLLYKVVSKIRVYVEGLPDPAKEKQYYYDTEIKDYQKFGRSISVFGSASESISVIKNAGASLKLIKYPSDAKFSDGFSFDSTDPQQWKEHNSNKAENDPEEILNQKIEEAIANNSAAMLANSDFLKAFDDYKTAVATGDTAAQELLSGKYRALLFYAQNDTNRDEIAEILSVYHDTLVSEAQAEYEETGKVSEPLFSALYEEYAANEEEGTVQEKIDAKFLIRGPRGGFELTKYKEDVTNIGDYSFLPVKTLNGSATINGIKAGTYVIAEQRTILDNYSTKGYMKLYTDLNGTKGIKDVLKTETFSYGNRDYTGGVVEVRESAGAKINYFDYIMIDYPYATLEVKKTAKKEKPEDETVPCDAAFRLVGPSYPMKTGAADDPLAEGGLNFMTDSGYARITGLEPGEYVLYEYRKGQSYTDEDGAVCEMEPGFEEYDTNASSDKSKLMEVYRFTAKAEKEATSVPFVAHVENLATPTLALIKLDGEEYEQLYKGFETNESIRQELLGHFADSGKFLNQIDVSFRVTGLSPEASYPDGKLFETKNNICMVTDLEPGTYRIQEEAILTTDGAVYDVNRKAYEVELTREHTIENPYLIVHPNYIAKPIHMDLNINKTDNMGVPLSEVTFVCASYIGEYVEGYTDNQLSQKGSSNYGKEYYKEGTVKNGQVSFNSIRVEVDGDNNVVTWVHLHETKGRAGYESVPVDNNGVHWNDYAAQCEFCQKTGPENANGLDLCLNDVKAFPDIRGSKTIPVVNNRVEAEDAYLVIRKTSPLGYLNIEGAEFELYTNPALGTPEKVPVGYVEDEKTGEMLLMTLEPDDMVTPQVNLVTNEKGRVNVKITKTWLDLCDQFKVKEVYVPDSYVISHAETSFRLTLGNTVILPIENDTKEGVPGQIILKKVAANEEKTPLAGAVFQLYEAMQKDGTWVKDETAPAISGMSDADGFIRYENLQLGKQYIAEEVQAPDGYQILESSKHILLTAKEEENIMEVVNITEQVQIEVIKTDVDTKEVLAGAEFVIKNEKGQIVSILKTDETGYAVSKKLERWPASKPHTIEEVTPPNDYDLPPNGGKQTIRLEEGKTLYRFSYEDEHTKGTIRIHKVSSDSGSLEQYPLTGTKFEVRKAGEDKVLDILIIGADGYSQISKPLKTGKYVITEVEVSDGYYLDKDGDHIPDTEGYSKTIELKTSETLTVECTNEPVAGRLEIHKVDSKDGKKAVGGVVFDLYQDDGTVNGTFIETLETDENGVAFSSRLFQGKYFYIEKKAPPNYWIDPTPHPFEINKTNMGLIQNIITNDLVELNIRVHKMDDKKRDLEGVGFTLYQEDGKTPVVFSQVVDEAGNTKEVTEFFTGEGGILIFPQKVGYGTYILKETTTPSKYKKAEDINIVIDSNTKYVEIEAIGKTVTCEVINYPKIAGIRIVKIDEEKQEPLSGVEFLVTCEENQYSKTFVTDANGEIHITGLEMGEYVYIETKPKEGYLGTTPDGKPITGTITVSEDGREYEVIVKNHKPKEELGQIKVKKVDKDTKEPLVGAVFHLYDTDKNLISIQTTNAAGEAEFTGLKPNQSYVVKEITPPPGYELPEGAQKSVTVMEGESKEIIFEDKKIVEELGKLIIRKKSDDGTLLPGAVFTITNTATGEKLQKETGMDGQIVVDKLPFGEYQVEEISPPSGYHLSEHPVQVILLIKGENRVVVTYVNDKIPEQENEGELEIIKVDAETGKTLSGVLFRILNERKEEVMRGMTGTDGKIAWKLGEGNYYYQELQSLEAYKPDSAMYPFQVKNKEKTKIRVKNTKGTGKLILNKVDSFSGVPIPNCTFVILDKDQKEILRDVTDKYGICEFSLPPGSYYYQELKAAPGYLLDSKPYYFEITTDGQVLYQTMKNTKEELTLHLLKLDAETGESLTGAVFLIRDQAGNIMARETTKKDGTVRITLPEGNYTYQEIAAPNGYQLDSTVYSIILKEGDEDITKSVTVYNHKTPSTPVPSWSPAPTLKPAETPKPTQTPEPSKAPIPTMTPEPTLKPTPTSSPTPEGTFILTKKDVNESSTVIPGTLITIRDNMGSIVFQQRTNEEGEVSFLLPVGTYTYQESEAAQGYLLDETPHPFEIKEGGEIIKAVMTNERLPEVWICKEDYETKERIPGCRFAIFNAKGEKVTEGMTDEDGIFKASLHEGNYQYQEIKAASGYLMDEAKHEFTVMKGKKNQITVTNVKQTITLPKTGEKIGDSNRLKSGWLPFISVLGLLSSGGFLVYLLKKKRK